MSLDPLQAYFLSLLRYASQGLRPFISEIATVLVLTLMVIYGDTINRVLKRHLRPYHFLLRTLFFSVFCAFGYGAIALYATPLLKHLMAGLNNLYLSPVVLTGFIGIGVLAERKKQL